MKAITVRLKSLACLACVLGSLPPLAHAAPRSPGNTTYYVDSRTGHDANAGTTETKAFKTLERVNAMVFAPGDRVLFKAGTRYVGQLKPQGSGAMVGGKAGPIVIGTYGRGGRPRIDGEGKVLSTVYLYNLAYWEVDGLEITNTGPTRKARRTGVYVHIRDFGEARHIRLRNLYVHDVNGVNVKKAGGGWGIRWRNEGRTLKSRFNGLLIEACRIERTDRNGIGASSGYWQRSKWHPSLNVVIRNNRLDDIGGDCIVPIGCDGAIIERNVVTNGGQRFPQGDAAAGIWPWSCDNTTIQYNEVSGQRGPWDGQGFDSDWNCRNTIIQYNYSHDNEGGFLLICDNGGTKMPTSVGNIGTIVRYNVSQNDGYRSKWKAAGFSPTFHISGPVKDTQIYNNVIFVGRKASARLDTTLIKMDNWGGPWPVNTRFTNNIFHAADTVKYDWGRAKGTLFTHNAYYGKHVNAPTDAHAVRADPLLVAPGKAAPGLDSLRAYMLRAASPCISAGLPVDNNATPDFWGNRITPTAAPSIGIHQFSTKQAPH